VKLVEFPVGRGQGPHDVAAGAAVAFGTRRSAPASSGYLDPRPARPAMVKLWDGSAPHGVTSDRRAPWVTDGGQTRSFASIRVSKEVKVFKLPGPNVNLNTAAFDARILWFTDRGLLRPRRSDDRHGEVMQSPRGAGPLRDHQHARRRIFYASLANTPHAWVDLKETSATPIDPPTPGQGARRVWSDSKSQIW